jgi:hypothetical protein
VGVYRSANKTMFSAKSNLIWRPKYRQWVLVEVVRRRGEHQKRVA